VGVQMGNVSARIGANRIVPTLPRNRRCFKVWVPTRQGRVKRSTGTADRATAKKMERMLVALGARGQREWDLLDRVESNTLKLSVLYDAWSMNDLDGLRARLDDVDLEHHVRPWTKWLSDRVEPSSADHYLAHVRTLMPDGAPFPRSQFTGPRIVQWLASRTALPRKRHPSTTGSRRTMDSPPKAISGSTKRRYLAAVKSFANYLQEVGVLASNPIRDVKAPRANPARTAFLELPDVIRLVEGTRTPYRAALALAYGGGLEVSAILALVESDVDTSKREVRARGTKTRHRDRIARVSDWAWPFFEAHLKNLTPGERVFRGITRWDVSDVHRERCRALGFLGARLHDARHHWAVRMVRTGMPLEMVARQLGHRDVVMVARVYGRFVPTQQERDRWERAAAALDTQKWGTMGTALGTSRLGLENEEVANIHDVSDFGSSRGGTRTRDPGIMSAVL